MLKQYTDLSDFAITFDPSKHSDKRWKKIFEDEYARVIFVGFRIQHLMSEEAIDVLMQESVAIGNEIRTGKLSLEQESLKERLKEMYEKMYDPLCISRDAVDNDINNAFVKHLLPYLKREKSFGYKIKK